MKIDEFLEKLTEVLELEDVVLKEETNLKDIEEYDSLSVLSIIAMIDERFGKQIPGNNFQTITTVKSLMNLIGKDSFE